MRIRFKKWARPELEASRFYIDEPEKYKGKWRTLFENNSPLYVELGCGKGGFISQIASENLNINYIAIDLVDAMLGLAKRNIEEVYAEKNEEINNVLISRYDIDRILNVFDENDKIDRIYINFCNPWPRGKHHKTDDDNLFTESLLYFKEAGFKIEKVTYDLANEQDFWNGDRNIETEHEKMFKEQGIKIKALSARK